MKTLTQLPMKFSLSMTEKEMVAALSSGLKSRFKTDVAIKEFSAGYGIADLVFARNFITTKNVLRRKPINNYFALKTLLAFDNDRGFNVTDVMRVTGTSKNMSDKAIKYLLGEEYIYETSGVYYKSNISLINPVKHLVAVEAKLKDWKQGILQARRYKSFTSECYLAILSKYEANIDRYYLDKFDIGLILFNHNNGNILIKRKPQKNLALSIYEEITGIFAKELFLNQTIASFSNTY